MLVDMHGHFPMHLLEDDKQRAHERLTAWWRHRWRGLVVELVSHFANYQGPGDTPSVTETLMRDGDVGVTLSVLYQAFDEIDLTQDYAAPPLQSYFADVVDQAQTVEDYVEAHTGDVVIAHSAKELDGHLSGGSGTPILVHAIEGGFHIGNDPAEVQGNVTKLAGLGVAYITVAHLFFRQVATNAPALPFLSDGVYNRVFHQDDDEGLTPLGHELVEAMVDEGILVDLTHMRTQSIRDVFALLDARDPSKEIPVIATHMAYRFGGLEYSFGDDTVREVAARGGLLGLILCQHYITSGLHDVAETFEGSVKALCRHIDKLRELTGSYDHIGIGSDLDGYIKPALPGLEHQGRMAPLQQALRDRYGDDAAEQIAGGNALRVLRGEWGRKRPRAPAPASA
ncbi:MAG TPA: membrane dipeptidase [Solirubrobacteraceae bacterium]|jgi:microsomal dipeptidase-like Zn-dependent dipeptidase|nr:membrane dipeptidase [Solirubrobacteraceae bacterium]